MGSVRAQTPLFFQETLAEEIRKITQEMRFIHPKSRKLVPLNVHIQALPVPKKKENVSQNAEDMFSRPNTIDYIDRTEEDAVFDCPWCLVKMADGKIPGINQRQEVNAVVCFGIFDDSPNNNGHREILNLIQKTYMRFAVNPLLDGQYTCKGNFEWALQEEDTFPYFFGAISMQFTFWGFRRESEFI